MKKIILLLVAIALLGSTLFACGAEQTQQPNRISYCQQSYYYGQDPDFVVRVVGGMSEELFVADGKAQDVKPFRTLTIVPQHVDLFNEGYTYVLTGDQGTIEGELAKDNFGASYSTPLVDMDAVGTPQSVRIKGGTIDKTISLENKLAGAISGEQALSVAEQAVQDKLSADNKDREIYVKYVNDSATPDSPYYWYVAFIAAPTDYFSVLVDGEGKVVSVNP